MSQSNELQQRVNQLEQLLTDTRQGLERQRQTRTRIAKALVAVLAVGALVAGVQEARAWGGCDQFLNVYGLKTFCAGDPASASDINGNFQVLAKALQDKTGAIASPNITAAETITAKKGIAVSGTISGGAYAPGAVDYATFVSSLGAVGGAAIVNDMTNYKGLMIMGNNATGGQRSVLVYDNLGVPNGDLNVGGNVSANGKLTVNSTLSGAGNICIGTYDCATAIDFCSFSQCPDGKVAVSTTASGFSFCAPPLKCCRLKLVYANADGTCP